MIGSSDSSPLLPFSIEEHRYWHVAVDLNVARLRSGNPSAETMMLVHGLSAQWPDFQGIMPALARQFHLIAPDLRGHGRSQHTTGEYTLDHYIGDVLALIDQIPGRINLLGHSMGGLIALACAARRPKKIKRLILIDPAFTATVQARYEFAPGRFIFEMTYDWLESAASQAELLEKLKSNKLRFADSAEARVEALWRCDPDALLALLDDRALTGYRFLDDFERVRCPILFFRADPKLWSALEDEDLEAVKAAVTSPLEIVPVPEAGHAIHHFQPERLVREILRFSAAAG